MPAVTGNMGIPAFLYSFIFLMASPHRCPGVQRKSSIATNRGIKLNVFTAAVQPESPAKQPANPPITTFQGLMRLSQTV